MMNHYALAQFEILYCPPPIAQVEAQGHVHTAKTAELYRVLGEIEKVSKLEQEALKLKDGFNKNFWMPNSQFFCPRA
jgi:glycogen debranching enzyme